MTTHSEPQAITLKTYRFASTDALEAKLDDLMATPVILVAVEDEELADAISDELSERELEASLPAYDDSLEDRGLVLGSYAS